MNTDTITKMSLKPDVRVALDKEGYLILAGRMDMSNEDTKEEVINLIEKGYTIKTVPYTEYKTLTWVWDKPGYVPPKTIPE